MHVCGLCVEFLLCQSSLLLAEGLRLAQVFVLLYVLKFPSQPRAVEVEMFSGRVLVCCWAEAWSFSLASRALLL